MSQAADIVFDKSEAVDHSIIDHNIIDHSIIESVYDPSIINTSIDTSFLNTKINNNITKSNYVGPINVSNASDSKGQHTEPINSTSRVDSFEDLETKTTDVATSTTTDSTDSTDNLVSNDEKYFSHRDYIVKSKQKGLLTKSLRVANTPNRGLAPSEFTYWVTNAVGMFTIFVKELHPELVTVADMGFMNIYFLSGYHTVRWCTFWIATNKSGIWFKSKEEYDRIYNELNTEYMAIVSSRQSKVVNQLYKFNPLLGRWEQAGNYKSYNGLIGCDHIVSTIENDLNVHLEHMAELAEIGEDKSLNYLFYGPPGVGKTSTIKHIAGKRNINVFFVNVNTLLPSQISQVLSPNVGSTGLKNISFVVFEDFDRFLHNTTQGVTGTTLDSGKSSILSSILNALDGIEDSSSVVRIFTANNYEKIASCSAIMNRMSAQFEFFYPTRRTFEDKLRFMLKKRPTINEIKLNRFLDLVERIKKLTLRPFSIYVVRYMFCPDYMDKLIENIAELGYVDVTGTDVTGTDVTGTDVTGTDVTGTDVTGTDVTVTDV